MTDWLLVPEYKCEVCDGSASVYPASTSLLVYLNRRRIENLCLTFHLLMDGGAEDTVKHVQWAAGCIRSCMDAPRNDKFSEDALRVKHDVAVMVAHYDESAEVPSLVTSTENSTPIASLMSNSNCNTVVLISCNTEDYIELLKSCAMENNKHVVFFNGKALTWNQCGSVVFGALLLHATRPMSIDEAFRVIYLVYCVCVCVLFIIISILFYPGAIKTFCFLRRLGLRETFTLPHTPQRRDDYRDHFSDTN